MNISDKIKRLRKTVTDELTPLVDRDYRYLMMTEHGNIGDTLIFQGELEFLKTVPFRCKEWTTISSFSLRLPKIPVNDLIIFRGGGSFGDLWPNAPSFWLNVLRNYPNNPILFMPQTAYFQCPEKRFELAKACEDRPGRTIICLRDRVSQELVKEHFKCETHLIPDMAFYINVDSWRIKRSMMNGRKLLIRRDDREAKETSYIQSLLKNDDVDVSDWPTMMYSHPLEQMMSRIRSRMRHFPRLYDLVIRYIYRPALLKAGFKFIEPYKEIYATRMHGGILALLLGKKTTFIDNSYGKTKAVFETWLADCDGTSLQ